MLFRGLRKLLAGTDASSQSVKANKGEDLENEEVPRYPPFVRGLPMLAPEKIVDSQKEMVLRIRQVLGLAPEEFSSLIIPLIESCAAFVHLLPASETHHHRGAGGLFRHSLEVGAWAAQMADGKTFAFGKTPLERKHEEPRWVVATFTAALLHDIGKAATDMKITSPDGTLEWSPYFETLWSWGQRNGVQRYFIRWRPGRHEKHEQAVLLLANHVLPVALRGWLGEKNPEIIRNMMEAASYSENKNVLTGLVKEADKASTDRDVKTNPSLGNEMAVGVPVERHIMDASRRLLGNGTWTVNRKGSRVWHTREGVFIVWKPAAEEIVGLLAEDRILGVPRDPDTLADLLLERDLAKYNNIEDPGHNRRYWGISPAVLDGRNGPIWLPCLKIKDPEILFSSEPPAPAKVLIKGPEGKHLAVDGAVSEEVQASESTQTQVPSRPVPAAPKDPEAKQGAGQSAKPSTVPSNPSGMKMPESSPASDAAAVPGDGPQTDHPQPQPEAAPVAPSKPQARAFSPAANDNRTPVKAVSPVINEGDGSERWLKEQEHDAAKLLLAMFRDISLGIRDKNDLFGKENGVVYLRFPDAIRPYGKPNEVSNHFASADWIVPDPEYPTRNAQQMNDGRGLVLKEVVAEHVRQILDHGCRRPELEPANKPKGKKTQDGKGHDSNKAAADQASTSDARQGEKPSASGRAQPPAPVRTKPAATSAPQPAAGRPQAQPSREPGRPPAPLKKVSAETERILDDFVNAVRQGAIESSTKKVRGEEYYVVRIIRLTQFAKSITANVLRAALEQRDDCVFEENTILVKVE